MERGVSIYYKIIVFAVLTLANVSTASADLVLQVVDYPQQVWVYSPLYVTAELKNDGTSALLVPLTEFASNGWSFEVKTNEGWRWYDTGWISDSIGSNLVWLQPGQSYFFQYDLNKTTRQEGIVEVRARVQSSGECQHLINSGSSQKYPVKKIRDITEGVVSLIECWKGDIASEAIKIKIEPPDNEDEKKILLDTLAGKYSEDPSDTSADEFTMAHSFSKLMKLHPKSHYTYVTAFYAPPSGFSIPYSYSIPLLLEAQPNSPLTPYAREQWILELQTKSFDETKESKFSTIDISSYNLPLPLEKYIQQQITEMKLAKMGRQ